MSSKYCDEGPVTIGYVEWQYQWFEVCSKHPSTQTMVSANATTTSIAATASETATGTTGTAIETDPATPAGAVSSSRQVACLLTVMAGLVMVMWLFVSVAF